MWTLRKTVRFEAAHRLPSHSGKCSQLHGHSWIAHFILQGDELCNEGSSTGMLEDFGNIKTIVQALLDEYLDHHYLNDSLSLENPTSENISKWIFDHCKESLPLLVQVILQESDAAACSYQP